MRFFAPIYIRPQEFWPIRLALRKNVSPIRTSIAYHGLVTFVPVRADAVSQHSFESNFLGNPYPLNELAALDGSILPWVFTEKGEQDFAAGRSGMVRFATQYEQFILGDIYIPKALKSGDILLCSRRYPSRHGEADMR
jgi:hypothetical protein